MAKDRNRSGRRKRWLRPAIAVLLVGVLLSAALLWLVSRGLLATFPQIIGHNCGEAYPGNDPLEAQRCFRQAYPIPREKG